jgi:hypothetical protein
MTTVIDPEALLVALIIAPATYSRNKFFELFQNDSLRHARRRAQLVRSVIKDLTEPWPYPGEIPPHPQAVIEAQVEQEDGLHLTYAVEELGYRRSTILTAIEAAALRYALSRAGKSEVSTQERALVESCLARLSGG